MALIHDDDLERIDGIRDSTSLASLRPDVVMGRLRKSNLEIQRFLCDLSPIQMSSVTGTELEVVRVACLSLVFRDQVTTSQLPLAPYSTYETMGTTDALYQQPPHWKRFPSFLERSMETDSPMIMAGESYLPTPEGSSASSSSATGMPPVSLGTALPPYMFDTTPLAYSFDTTPFPYSLYATPPPDSPPDSFHFSPVAPQLGFSASFNTDTLQPDIVQNVPGPSSPVPVSAVASEDEHGTTLSGQSTPKTYSFVSLPGNVVRKHLYHCSWPGCTKSYVTLNLLNVHIAMQRHGDQRTLAEFEESKKQWCGLKLLERAKERSAKRSKQALARLQSPPTPSASQINKATVVAGTGTETPSMGSHWQSVQRRHGDPVSDTAHSLQSKPSQLPKYSVDKPPQL
ncbi:hypothetical protein BC826DRAFT_62265 [Russula brevipes]|nr:hypothetical protein BC826DRAFT_62265 [Russula brevipes]